MLGHFTSQSVVYMTNYGITDKINVLASLPYVWTKMTGGTLHQMDGFQDVSVAVKWEPYSFKVGKGKLSLFAVGGFSTPVTNYVIDFQPLAIGLGSTNLSGRITADYQQGIFFATLSSAYVWRSNVKYDKTAYYDTEQHNSNEVKMPDLLSSNLFVGVRIKYLVAQATLENMTTLGGFDMRKNDMPFCQQQNEWHKCRRTCKIYAAIFSTHRSVGRRQLCSCRKKCGPGADVTRRSILHF